MLWRRSTRRGTFGEKYGGYRATACSDDSRHHAPLLHGVGAVLVRRRLPVRRLSYLSALARPEPIPNRQRAGDVLRCPLPDRRADGSLRRSPRTPPVLRARRVAPGLRVPAVFRGASLLR